MVDVDGTVYDHDETELQQVRNQERKRARGEEPAEDVPIFPGADTDTLADLGLILPSETIGLAQKRHESNLWHLQVGSGPPLYCGAGSWCTSWGKSC